MTLPRAGSVVIVMVLFFVPYTLKCTSQLSLPAVCGGSLDNYLQTELAESDVQAEEDRFNGST